MEEHAKLKKTKKLTTNFLKKARALSSHFKCKQPHTSSIRVVSPFEVFYDAYK